MPQSAPLQGSIRRTVITDGDAHFATCDEVQYLADRVTDLQGEIQNHDQHAAQLVAQALATMLEKLPEALEEATERAMRRVATDQTLHKQIGASVLEQAAGNMYWSVGRFIFSKWFAIAALVVVVANAIGWPATIKALLTTVFKGGS
jgi:hypothetical protein